MAHEVLTSSEVEQRFPGYHLPPSFQTMYEPEGGFLVPERCIQAHLHLAQRHGAELLCGAKVLGWQVLPPSNGTMPDGSSGGGSTGGSSGAQGLVRVQTTRGEFIARRLVLAAGGWMPQLVPQLRVRSSQPTCSTHSSIPQPPLVHLLPASHALFCPCCSPS